MRLYIAFTLLAAASAGKSKRRKDVELPQGRDLQQTLPFSKVFRAVTDENSIDTVTPKGLTGGTPNAQGSSITQSGGVFKQSEVTIRDRSKGINGFRFAGGKQPTRFPARRTNWFWEGECTATTSKAQAQILSHSCLYNLCLGGGGLSCVNIYAGGTFEFTPTADGGTNLVPPLPPTFEGVIIGGTGSFVGIEGFVTIATLTGRTPQDSRDIQRGFVTQEISTFTTIELPDPPGQKRDIGSP